MPTIDDRTTNLSLAKPNVANTLQADVARLREALDAIDAELVALDNSNIAAGAEIAVSKLADGIARQVLQTDAAGTGVEWTSNVDLPGTLDVTGAATFDSAVTVPLGTAGAPALQPVGSSTTGIFYPDTSTVAVSTGGSEWLRVDNAGKLMVGLSTARTNFYNNANISPPVQVEGVSNSTSSLSVVRSSNDNQPARIIVGKTRGAVGSSTITASGDNIGQLSFQSADGSDVVEAARIEAAVDGTPASNDMPGRIVFSTTPAGAATPAEAMRLTSAKNLKIGGTANRATTEGTNQLVIFNGTAPVGTLTNGISLYSASGECRVMDAAGNSTLLSPHDRETNEWIYDSTDTTTGKRLRIDMEKMMKFLDAHFGLGFVQETFGDPA